MFKAFHPKQLLVAIAVAMLSIAGGTLPGCAPAVKGQYFEDAYVDRAPVTKDEAFDAVVGALLEQGFEIKQPPTSKDVGVVETQWHLATTIPYAGGVSRGRDLPQDYYNLEDYVAIRVKVISLPDTGVKLQITPKARGKKVIFRNTMSNVLRTEDVESLYSNVDEAFVEANGKRFQGYLKPTRMYKGFIESLASRLKVSQTEIRQIFGESTF